MLVLEGLLVFIEPFNFSLFSITGWVVDLDYCDIEWFALETNRDHSVVFEIASKYCILGSFVDYDGYSISYKGFLPTEVDIMVRGQGQQPRGATPHPRSGVVAEMSYHTPEVRAVAESSYHMPEVRGGEEQPHIEGAVAAWAQEGGEELLHVQGQEGRP